MAGLHAFLVIAVGLIILVGFGLGVGFLQAAERENTDSYERDAAMNAGIAFVGIGWLAVLLEAALLLF